MSLRRTLACWLRVISRKIDEPPAITVTCTMNAEPFLRNMREMERKFAEVRQ